MSFSTSYYYERISGTTYNLYDGQGFGSDFYAAFRIMKRTITVNDNGDPFVEHPVVYASTLAASGSLNRGVVVAPQNGDTSTQTVLWWNDDKTISVSIPYESHRLVSIKELESDTNAMGSAISNFPIGYDLSQVNLNDREFPGTYIYDDGTEFPNSFTGTGVISYDTSLATSTTKITCKLTTIFDNKTFTFYINTYELLIKSNPTKTHYIWSSKVTDFSFAGTEVDIVWYNGGSVTSTIALTSDNLDFTYDAVNKANTISHYPYSLSTKLEYYGYGKLTHSYTSQNSPLSCEPLTASLSINIPSAGVDDNQYFNTGKSEFRFPKYSGSNAIFTLAYNDSENVPSVTIADNSIISFYCTGISGALTVKSDIANGTAMSVLAGTSSDTYAIEAVLPLANLPSSYEKPESISTTGYHIGITKKAISSIALPLTAIFIRGNVLSTYHPTLTATYNDGDTASYTDYSWGPNQENVIAKPNSTISSLTIVDNATSSYFTLGGINNISLKNPTVSSVTLSKNVTTTYNVLSTIKIGELTATMKYSDATVTETTNSISYLSASPTATSDGVLYIYSKDNAIMDTWLSGSTAIPKNATASELDGEVNFSMKDPFNSSASSYVSASPVTFRVLAISKIDGIYVTNVYNDYHIGDYLLNDNDTTDATIYYTDTSGVAQSYTGKLKDMLGALNIYPAKGTLFTMEQTGRKVVVSSSYDSTVSYAYDIDVSSRYSYESVSSSITLAAVRAKTDFDYKFLSNDGLRMYTHHFSVGDWMLISEDDFNSSLVDKDTLTMVDDGYLLKDENDTNESLVVIYGYVQNVYGMPTTLADFLDNDMAEGRNCLFHDYKPEVEGQPNITVTFPCVSLTQVGDDLYATSDLINKCTIGICFGHNNNANRLWASGNSLKPNFDYHSTEPNSANDDTEASYSGGFGYFTEESESKYGETDNKVIGYEIISDSKLIVYKDHSSKEPCIYFRVPKLATAYDSLGNVMKDQDGNTLYQEEYTLSVSNSPISAISNQSHANFNGDSLFVDNDNEVAGLDVEGIIGDSQRQGNTRSYYIDKALKECDMSSSLLFVSGRTLYLYAPGYGIFVSDRDSKSNNQYEWWLLDDRKPTCFFDNDGKVYFGDANGRIYLIDKSTYKDSERMFVQSSELVSIYPVDNPATLDINEDDRVLVTNNDVITLLLSDPTSYMFKPVPTSSSNNDNDKYMFARIGELNKTYSSDASFYIDATNNVIAIKNKAVSYLIGSLNDYYLNYAASLTYIKTDDATSFQLYKKYKLVEADIIVSSYENYGIYYLEDESGNVLNLSNLTLADLCYQLNGEYHVTNVTRFSDKIGGYFSLLDDGSNVIDTTCYGNQKSSRNFKSEITKYSNVTAKLITAPLMADTSNWFKTVWKIAVTNGANLDSDLDIAYVSNKVSSEDHKTINSVSSSVAVVSRAVSGFSFEGADFMAMDFSKSLVPRSVVINRQIGHCKSLTMMMRSDNAAASIIPTLSITYTIPHPSEGSN